MSYLLVGREVAPTTGTCHWQGYVETSTRVARSSVVAMLGCDKAPHVEIAKGSAEQNRVYCCKDEEYIEWGEPMKQGQRSDLQAVCDAIRGGTATVGQMMDDDPYIYHQYGRTLQAVEDRHRSKLRRTEAPNVRWYWGTPGAGKSRLADEEAGVDAYVLAIEDKGWWDDYNGEENVLIDDFRPSDMKFNTLLRILDRTRFKVPRRGRCPTPLLAKNIWVTSSQNPTYMYTGVGEDIQQLLRRITTLREFRLPDL